jgi:hypothetical protein
MREGFADRDAFFFLHAIKLGKVAKQHGKPLRHRARAEHLHQGRKAFALEFEGLDDRDSEHRNSLHELEYVLTAKGQDIRFRCGHSRPLMNVCAENLRRADDIAGLPIGERDLTSGG